MHTTAPPAAAALTADDFDALDTILDDLRSRFDETPQWEFCEGFLAALVCCRRPIAAAEYLPVLLDVDDAGEGEGAFADAGQRARIFAQREMIFAGWFIYGYTTITSQPT